MDRLASLQPYYVQEGCATSAYPLLVGTILFTLVMHTWERYLDWRQHKRIEARGLLIPPELTSLVEQIGDAPKKDEDAKDEKEDVSSPAALLGKLKEKAPATQSYNLDKSRFKFFSSSFGLVKGLAFILLGAMPLFWDTADSFAAGYFPGSPADREIKTSIVFYAIWELVDTALNLPISLYSTFVIEAKHGFNKQTYALFATDMLKSLALEAVLGAPVLAAFLKVINYAGPQNLATYVGGFFFTFSLTFITIYPALASSIDYPLYKLYMVDGSKRSGHSNAYMYGFFKSKRIVLFDTLLKQMTNEEIVGVLAHELGHWAHGHVLFSFCFSQAYIFVAFSFFARAMGSADIYTAFGFAATAGASDTAGAPVMVGVLLFFMVLWEPVDHALSFFMTWNSRRMEFQADQYGTNLGYAAPLQRGLVKITFENLGVLDPDPLFSTYHHSHPPLVQRRAIEEGEEVEVGAAPASIAFFLVSWGRNFTQLFIYCRVLADDQR
ncbi:hypothetical protein JL720_5708 [Aureococcus anophagefferens]|nr:hypothetical protein JL720_5708 [Aureococcus anophagefferens]